MIRSMKGLLLTMVVGLAFLVACGGGNDGVAFVTKESLEAGIDAGIPTESVTSAPSPAPPGGETGRSFAREVPVVVEKEVTKEVMVEAVRPSALSLQASVGRDEADVVEITFGEEQVAQLVTQQRIIVRTVDMRVVVSDVAASIDRSTELAQELGGWVVSTNRSEKHRGFISIRVPAERLDEAILRLRQSAVEVESEVSTSRDVTDEYVDTRSRLTNLTATEGALLELLKKAEKVEDALNVQEALTRVQGDIERLQGRIKFLEQTSAFSLLNLSLVLEAAEMESDAGPDQTEGVGEAVRFRAFFSPPEGIEEFSYTWDFGDGTPIIHSSRTAPTEDEGKRVTATVSHVYFDERDSPYIAQFEITGSGEAGLAEGEDTLIVTVTRVPTIEVFAGDTIIVKEGEQVEFNGSFTRPEGLKDLKYRWTFGDGTTPSEGDLEAGVTNAVTTHVYPDHRPLAFTATLTIIGESDAGAVESSSSVRVLVTESEGWVVAGWSAGEQVKIAVRSLSAVGQWGVTGLVWAGIFSPLILAAAVVAVLLNRRRRARAGGPGTG